MSLAHEEEAREGRLVLVEACADAREVPGAGGLKGKGCTWARAENHFGWASRKGAAAGQRHSQVSDHPVMHRQVPEPPILLKGGRYTAEGRRE